MKEGCQFEARIELRFSSGGRYRRPRWNVARRRKHCAARCLAVPARDSSQAVRNVLDLDVDRRGVKEVEAPPAEHALPGTGGGSRGGHERPDVEESCGRRVRKTPCPCHYPAVATPRAAPAPRGAKGARSAASDDRLWRFAFIGRRYGGGVEFGDRARRGVLEAAPETRCRNKRSSSRTGAEIAASLRRRALPLSLVVCTIVAAFARLSRLRSAYETDTDSWIHSSFVSCALTVWGPAASASTKAENARVRNIESFSVETLRGEGAGCHQPVAPALRYPRGCHGLKTQQSRLELRSGDTCPQPARAPREQRPEFAIRGAFKSLGLALIGQSRLVTLGRKRASIRVPATSYARGMLGKVWWGSSVKSHSVKPLPGAALNARCDPLSLPGDTTRRFAGRRWIDGPRARDRSARFRRPHRPRRLQYLRPLRCEVRRA